MAAFFFRPCNDAIVDFTLRCLRAAGQFCVLSHPNFFDLPDRRVAYSPGTPVLCLIMGTEFRLNQLLCEPIQGTILGKVGHDTYRVQFSRATHRRTLVVHGRIDSPRIQWVAYPDPVRYTTATEAHRDQHRAALRVITSYGLPWQSGVHGVNYITVECSDGDCPLDLARAAGLIR